MDPIKEAAFSEQLLLTQWYCRCQEALGETDPATIFRSCNPIWRGTQVFSFEATRFGRETSPGSPSYTTTQWAADPFEGNAPIRMLFDYQSAFKQIIAPTGEPGRQSEGRVLVARIDETVTDGGSEVASLGLVDVYDLPPDRHLVLHSQPQRNPALICLDPRSLCAPGRRRRSGELYELPALVRRGILSTK